MLCAGKGRRFYKKVLQNEVDSGVAQDKGVDVYGNGFKAVGMVFC
jgi:hypothetical protein